MSMMGKLLYNKRVLNEHMFYLLFSEFLSDCIAFFDYVDYYV